MDAQMRANSATSSISTPSAMVSRGPAVHHVRRTTNPFMTTSSGIVGINLSEGVTFNAPKLTQDNQSSINATPASSGTTLQSFMYQTTTQALGNGVYGWERSRLSQCMDKPTLRKGKDHSQTGVPQ